MDLIQILDFSRWRVDMLLSDSTRRELSERRAVQGELEMLEVQSVVNNW